MPNRNHITTRFERVCGPLGLLVPLCLFLWTAAQPAARAAEPAVTLNAIAPESGSDQAPPSTRLVIEGSATGDDFGSAVIDYGQGEYPAKWESIVTLKQPVAHGRLAVWETKALPGDRYTVRLTFYSKAGVFTRTQQLVDLRPWRSDLVVRQVISRLDGGALTVAVDIANQGRQPVPGPIRITVGLVNDSPETNQVTESASLVRLARWELNGSLPAGGQASKTGAVTFPSTMPPGRYRVAVVVDDEGAIADADRANNRAVAGSTVDVGADLVITQLKAELTADGASITVADQVDNRGLLPATASATVSYYLSADGVIQDGDALLGRRPVPALRGGESSRATTRLSLPAGIASGSYFVLGRVNASSPGTSVAGQARSAETAAANNDYWGSQLTLGPDLAITALSAEIDAGHRQLVVTDLVKNVGRYQAEGSITVAYRLLKEEGAGGKTVSAMAIQAAPQIGQRELAGPLAPGAERKTVTPLPLPEGLSPGRYRLIGELDPLQRIPDGDRGNNQRLADPLAVGYDLDVTALSAAPSSDGLQLTVTDTVANQGLLPADGPITVRYLLRDESTRAGSDQHETPIGRRTVDGSLAPGARSTGTVTLLLPDGAGSRRWRLVAAVEASGIDTQSGNDRRSTDSLINDGVDLALGKTTVVLSTTADRLTVTDTVHNYGRAPLGAPVRVVYALSATGGLIDGHETVLGSRTIAALAAGGESTMTTALAVPPTLEPNRYFVIIQVDPDRRVAELKRDNNLTAGQRITIGPEPVLESVDAKLKPDGTAVAVKVTVTNRGNRPSGPVALTFGVSAGDKQAQSVIELGRQSVAPLPPGRRATPDFTLPVPATLPAGAYFVTARLDGQPGDQPPTVTPAALPLGPDLLTQSLNAQLIGAGEQLKAIVTDTIVNEGNQGVAHAFTVRYFLSTDWRLDGGDIPLGQRKIEALPAHEQNSATAQFPVPVQTIETGRYFVLSRIDLEGTVQESDRTNNLRPTVEGLLIDRLERKRAPDMPDVTSGGQ